MKGLGLKGNIIVHHTGSRSYHFRVFLYFLLILVITVASLLILDQKYLDRQLVSDFHHELETAARQIEFEIEMNREHLQSQTSRTMIRNELYRWYEGEISFESLQAFTEDKYIDGISVYDNIRDAVRYDLSGRVVCEYIIEDEKEPPSLNGDFPQIRYDHSIYHLSLKNSIVDRGAVIGYDVATFRLDSIESDFVYLDNPRIIPASSLPGESAVGSYRIGTLEYFLAGDMKQGIASDRRNRHMADILKWIGVLILLISGVSYFTMFKMTGRLIEDLEDAGRVNLQQERFAVIGRIGAGLAHDFNNILNIILGYVELMQSDEASGSLRDKLDIVHTNTLRASHLIRQIMDYSKIGYTRQEQFALKNFIIGLFRGGSETGGIKLTYDLLIPEDLTLNLDRVQLKILFSNLMTNAREAGSRNVIISCTLPDQSKGFYCPLCSTRLTGRWVCISFRNDGEPIDPDISIESLFEPFFSTKGPQNPGLGLSQAYGIIRQQGGHIGVNRSCESGVEFLMYFPLDDAAGNL